MDSRISSRGLSSVVGMVLLLLVLMMVSALVYNILEMIYELSSLSLDSIERVLLRAKIPHFVDGDYIVLNTTLVVLRINNSLPEPLQIVGYVIVYHNIRFETLNLGGRYIVPPLNTTVLTLDVYEKPLNIITVVLVRDSVTHIVLKERSVSH